MSEACSGCMERNGLSQQLMCAVVGQLMCVDPRADHEFMAWQRYRILY